MRLLFCALRCTLYLSSLSIRKESHEAPGTICGARRGMQIADLQIDLDWLLSYPVIGEPLTDAVLTPYRTSLS
jgi:hypothetical protein